MYATAELVTKLEMDLYNYIIDLALVGAVAGRIIDWSGILQGLHSLTMQLCCRIVSWTKIMIRLRSYY
jgi:hypothetical protein